MSRFLLLSFAELFHITRSNYPTWKIRRSISVALRGLPASVLCNKTDDSSHLSPTACFTFQLSAVMAGILHRTLRLRTALSALSSTATARPSHVDLCSPVHLTSSWQLRACCRKLHAGADGPKQSPAAAPERLPFSRVTEEDLNFFRKILQARTITDPDLLESSNVDWLKSVRGETWN